MNEEQIAQLFATLKRIEDILVAATARAQAPPNVPGTRAGRFVRPVKPCAGSTPLPYTTTKPKE
jgi:hypothetical protein